MVTHSRKNVSLAVPNYIRTAQRNIRSVEFRRYLKEEYPHIRDINRFLKFMHDFLENLGVGISYVSHNYGTVSPMIMIDENDSYSSYKKYPSQHFPQTEMPEGKKKRTFCLTNHNALGNACISLPINDLYKWCKDENIRLVAKVTTGSEEDIDALSFAVALGGHEAYHSYHDNVMSQRELEASFAQYIADSMDSKKVYNNPEEVGARQAARESLAYYRMRQAGAELARM